MPALDPSPRNRIPERLGILEIEVYHGDGVLRFDPNGQVMSVATDPTFILSLKPMPGLASVISGAPAILYRTQDLAVPLTPWEYVGLVGRELEPAEFHALYERFGDAFDWHDDFYSPSTGEAFQPMEIRGDLVEWATERGLIPATRTP